MHACTARDVAAADAYGVFDAVQFNSAQVTVDQTVADVGWCDVPARVGEHLSVLTTGVCAVWMTTSVITRVFAESLTARLSADNHIVGGVATTGTPEKCTVATTL
jgi:hypothetical protein